MTMTNKVDETEEIKLIRELRNQPTFKSCPLSLQNAGYLPQTLELITSCPHIQSSHMQKLLGEALHQILVKIGVLDPDSMPTVSEILEAAQHYLEWTD